MDIDANSLASLWIASAGALGATLNAVATHNGHLLPRFALSRSRLVVPGLLVNVLAGFVLCGVVSWVFLGLAGDAATDSGGSLRVAAGVVLGALASRAITGEADRRLLRAAVCAAAAAPAADAETIRTLAMAPPADVLRAAVALEPRKALLRL
jgi:hypothetical protein